MSVEEKFYLRVKTIPVHRVRVPNRDNITRKVKKSWNGKKNKKKKGSGGCFLAGSSTYLFRRMFRGSRTHHCALRLMRRLGTAHCALYVTLCALVNNARVWLSLFSLSFSLSFLLDLTGSIFAQASDQTRLTTSFPILLRAFHSTRFELNATRPRLRSAISSFSSPLLVRPNLPRGRCRRVWGWN